jgi:predicted phosphodiesterase
MSHLRVAVVGCLHGLLEELYEAVEKRDKDDQKTTDLVIICGDLQVRNILSVNTEYGGSKDSSYPKEVSKRDRKLLQVLHG